MIDKKSVTSVENLICMVRKDYKNWKTESFPWFRGEPNNIGTPLLPKLFRPAKDGRKHQENKLLQYFRAKAPIYGHIAVRLTFLITI